MGPEVVGAGEQRDLVQVQVPAKVEVGARHRLHAQYLLGEGSSKVVKSSR